MSELPNARQHKRRAHIDTFLLQAGISPSALAQSTQKCLDDWARQDLLVQDQPSANYWNVVMGLCRAVECQIDYSLGRVHGLEMLAGKEPMGAKGHGLKGLVKSLGGTLTPRTNHELKQLGIKPMVVTRNLPSLLLSLARVRKETNSAHGNAVVSEATQKDASRARHLARQILQGICAKSEGKQ